MKVPKRYGFAYHNFERDVRYYAIIPLNLIIAFAWHAWFWVKYEKSLELQNKQHSWVISTAIKQAEKKAYECGYQQGVYDGYHEIKTP